MQMTCAIEARQIRRCFGPATALHAVDLIVQRGEFFCLLGPSGCGKTTLLRIIAGLDQPESGSLKIAGQEALAIPAHRRPVNTVFQSYALFPHLDVFDNVAFGLRMRRLPRGQIKEKVERMLALMQISDLRTRRPLELSGGEKQRVALARAVVNEPDILLLDEPLGALDLKLRQQLQIELHRWQRELGMTFLYVTHDQDEALTLSDRIAVLNAGRIEQVGTGEDLYERPASRFVAQFLGRCNLLDATVSGHEPGGGAMLTTLCGRITGPTASTPGPVMLAIRPEKILLDPPGEHRNELKGVVREVVYNGAETHYTVQAGQADLRVTILNAGTAASPRFVAGQSVRLVLPVDALRVLAH